MPAVLLVVGLSAGCAEGTLDPVDPATPDASTPDDSAADAIARDASPLDASTVDDLVPLEAAVPDVPVAPADVAPFDAPQAADRVTVIDGESELTDAPAVLDAGVDAGVDVPSSPPDTGWGEGPTGYRVVRDDPSGRWVDACAQPGHQTVLVDADNGSFRATLPFRFRFWGLPLAEGADVLLSPNGYLTFQPAAPTPANGIIPNHLDGVDAVIAAQWRDLRARAGLCLAVVDNPGARRWVIQWSDARYITSIFGHLNFEIVLDETSNAIDVIYDQMTLSEPATVALESWDGARSAVPFGGPVPIVFSNTRARFIPQ